MRRLLATSALLLFSAPAMALEPWRNALSVGLSTGRASFDQTPLSPSEDSLVAGAQVVAPFSAAPFDDVAQSGFEVKNTAVLEHVRVSASYRQPVATFAMADTVVPLDDERSALTRQLFVRQYSLGLGYELPWDDSPVVPYAEVVGVHQDVRADLALPEGVVRYKGSAFGFHGRAGVVAQFSEVGLIEAYGQQAFIGQEGWQVGLMVGITPD